MVKDIIISLALALLLLEVLRLNRTLSTNIKAARKYTESMQSHTIIEVASHVNKTAGELRGLCAHNREAINKITTVLQVQDKQLNSVNAGFRLVSQKIDMKEKSLDLRIDGVLKLVHERTK